MKVFICARNDFPKCCAAANYIEYLARAICYEGVDVWVIGTTSDIGRSNIWIEYKNMKYCNVYYDVSDSCKAIHTRLTVGNTMWKAIEPMIQSGDIIICYTDNYFMICNLYKKAQKRGAHLMNCVVEWHMANQFKYSYFDVFNYWYFMLTFHKGYCIGKKVIVISRMLEKHFLKEGCKVLRIPVLTDPYEVEMPKKVLDTKIEFIYSGNYKNKDALEIFIKAMVRLSQEELEKMHLNLAGPKEKQLKEDTQVTEAEWNRICPFLTFYGWLQYDQLQELYKQMDFLAMPRNKNRVTMAGFPSKVPETMSYGIIPIINQDGDCPELFLHDGIDSILIRECTVEACVEVIRRALNLSLEQREAMRKNARKMTENLLYYKNWGTSIVDFLSN